MAYGEERRHKAKQTSNTRVLPEKGTYLSSFFFFHLAGTAVFDAIIFNIVVVNYDFCHR